MATEVTEISMAFAAGIMNDGYTWIKHNLITGKHQACAQIHILIIEEIAFVKPTHARKDVTAKQHEHSGDPVRIDWLLAYAVVRLLLPIEKFSYDDQWRGHTASTVFNRSFHVTH